MQISHSPPVCMRPQPTDALVAGHVLRNRWVVQQAQLVVMAGMQRADGVCLCPREPQSLDEGVENELGRLVKLPEEAAGKFAEARERLLGQPDVVLHSVLLTANLIAFLVVGRGRVLLLQSLILGLAGCLDSAALSARARISPVRRVAVGMRRLHLVGVGQGEELLGHGKGLLEQLVTDAVTRDSDAAVDAYCFV